MPPRAPPDTRGGGGGGRGGRGGGRGGPRGGPPPRGGPRGGPPQAGPAGGRSTPSGPSALPGTHVQAVGVKRPGYGTAGRAVTVFSNFFKVSLPESVIHHYDGWYRSFFKVPSDYLISYIPLRPI
jgi:eukaryotic translation initiation factor 2C